MLLTLLTLLTILTILTILTLLTIFRGLDLLMTACSFSLLFRRSGRSVGVGSYYSSGEGVGVGLYKFGGWLAGCVGEMLDVCFFLLRSKTALCHDNNRFYFFLCYDNERVNV